MKWKLGTRGSALALAQSKEIKACIEAQYPQIEVELVMIVTHGDKHQQISLTKLNDKGIFVKEIEEALLHGSIDLAVHSMKDMPSTIDERLCFCDTILREDARDALVLRSATSLSSLKKGARIATGSMRRAIQLQQLRPDIEIVDIRGNVETRLEKMEKENLDGIVLAAAGIHRLHLDACITMYFDESDMIPSCGQGALAIETRVDHRDIIERLHRLRNERVHQEVAFERALLKEVGAGCKTPFGVRAHLQGEQMEVYAMLGNEQGRMKKVHHTFPIEDTTSEIKKIAHSLQAISSKDTL